ncbi:MAG: hypothetical protein HY289_04455 [Planctomycetes bacterium]|nr:hypothetical protein [Planctomycetota bacterium]
MRYGVLLAALTTFILVGCSSPRMVSSTPDGGCVAIADNSNTWPSYNRRKALDMISEKCPGGYKIVREEEVVTGQTTTNNTQRDAKEVPIVKGVITGVSETTKRTTEVHDRTEYRIYFQKN